MKTGVLCSTLDAQRRSSTSLSSFYCPCNIAVVSLLSSLNLDPLKKAESHDILTHHQATKPKAAATRHINHKHSRRSGRMSFGGRVLGRFQVTAGSQDPSLMGADPPRSTKAGHWPQASFWGTGRSPRGGRRERKASVLSSPGLSQSGVANPPDGWLL